MTQEDAGLWERIHAFDIDGAPNNPLPFAARLARENRWTRSYADRVILEYKRFVFLCLSDDRPMCPSEQVDQAWHLHLTYTRSYWQRFCKETLGQPLHHEPTRGGAHEAAKHLSMYANTLAAYRAAFRQDPPPDIWSPAEQRFGDDLAERRVNIRHYWLLPKALFKQAALALGLFVACATLFVGCEGKANPFEANGTDFLPYYIGAYVVAMIFALMLRRHFRKPDADPDEPLPSLDDYETAYLAGGIPRVQAVALVRLKEGNIAYFDSEGKVHVTGPLPGNPDLVEGTVYAELGKQVNHDFRMKPISLALKKIEQQRFARLETLGLRTHPDYQFAGRLLPLLLAMLPIVVLGGPRFFMGLNNHRPVGFLLATMVIGFIISLVVLLRPLRRSRRGDAVVTRLQAQYNTQLHTLNNSSMAAEIAPLVAIYGTTALVGTSYGYMQQRMKPLDHGGAGGCSSGGCGTGGCGGGGDSGGGGGGGCGGGCGGCGGGGGD